jgi:putative membrane protein
MRLLLHWILSALALLGVAHYVPGFRVSGFLVALIAALVIGLVNGTVGLVLKILTFPFSIVTFGIFLLVINALMLKLAAAFVPGFQIYGFMPAFWGALLLAILNMIVRWFLRDKEESA